MLQHRAHRLSCRPLIPSSLTGSSIVASSSDKPQPNRSSAGRSIALRMSGDARYAYPYASQGYYQGPYGPYQGPPVMAPPQYQQYAPPPPRTPGFLEGCLAALCCCCLLDECCCDPSIIFVT